MNQDWATKDFYAALGLKKSATADEIKSAYRKLARQYHPDKNPGDKVAETRFKEISEAYNVLKDPEDRKQYDAIRTMTGGGRFAPGAGGGFGGFNAGGAGFEDIFGGMFGGGNRQQSGSYTGATYTGTGDAPGFEDILSNMFGGGAPTANGNGGFGPFGRRRAERGGDLTASTSLTFRQAVEGATITLTINGKQVTARIPQGVADGQKIRLKGKGQPGMNGGENGDLLITVSVEKHPVYELTGHDLYVNVPISFDEAALGATVEVPTVTGENVRVKIPAGSSSDKVMRVRGKGVDTKRGKVGDLYVRLKINAPEELNDDARRALELYRAAMSDVDPREGFANLARV